ncbi:hypothetical protein M8N52_23615, partial [Enterobacter hormaechei]|nr:hypothetical protein [Enterobacter hormaechei]
REIRIIDLAALAPHLKTPLGYLMGSMVRRLNHCFKNVLTMNIGFRSPVIAGSHATYDDKIQFLAHF